MRRLAPLFLIFAALVAACGPPVEETESPQIAANGEAPAPERVVITVNNGPRPGEDERAEEWALMEAMFEERHPDIDIVVSDWVFDPEDFVTRAISGDLETIIETWATEGFRMIQGGHAADITDRLSGWAHWRDIDEQVAAPFVRNGQWYGIPIQAYSMALYLNRQIFVDAGIVDENGEPDPPDTWDELRAVAEQLTDHSIPRYGFLMLGQSPLGGWHFLNWGWQAGGEYEVLNDEGQWEAAFASEEMASAFRFLQALRWESRAIQPSAVLRDREAWQMFAADQAAMMMGAASEYFFNQMKDEYDYDLSNIFVAPLPAGPGGRAHQVGANYLMINARATEEQQRAAFEWLMWNVDPEWLRAKWELWQLQGRAIGYPMVPVFHGDLGEQVGALIEELRTFPRYPGYEEGIVGTLRTEPPVDCQALYSNVLNPTLQAVLGDAEADPLEILRGLEGPFVRDYIDPFNAQMSAE